MCASKWLRVALLGLGLLTSGVQAAEINAAVAANFTEPMKLIAADFQRQSGHQVKLSFGSSGKFYAQIKQGAPFDVLLAADVKNPALLEQEGLAGTPFVYALGKLVLWSPQPGLVDGQGAVLASERFKRLAYADPKLAPYGLAAQQTLQKLKLWERVQGKLVTGENIAQTYQFAASGNAELAFVALAQILPEGGGSYWLVPETLYQPIQQAAVLLRGARDPAAATALLTYLKSDAARAVMRRFGYGLP